MSTLGPVADSEALDQQSLVVEFDPPPGWSGEAKATVLVTDHGVEYPVWGRVMLAHAVLTDDEARFERALAHEARALWHDVADNVQRVLRAARKARLAEVRA